MNISLLVLLELFLALLVCRKCTATAHLTLKEQFVFSFVAVSAVLCLATEALSLSSLLYEGPITRLHTLFVGILLVAVYRTRGSTPTQSRADLLIITCAVVCAIPAFITALAAPPNNWDSMTYHLPRVFHWLQNHSLQHYATYVARQLYHSPGHEFLLTHIIALAGNDLHAGALNSTAFLVALLASAAITERLGGKLTAQLSAVVLCATIPMAILQSSTTQNDLLLGTYLLSFILGALITKAYPSATHQFLMWAGAGMSVATKSSAFFFLPPAVLFFFPFSVCRRPVELRTAIMGLLLALALNVGHWARNYDAVGHPLLPGTGPTSSETFSVQSPGIASTTSNLARYAFLHSNTAIPIVQRWIQHSVVLLHTALDIDPASPDTTLSGTTLSMAQPTAIHEDLAGNGNHLLLILTTAALVVLTPRITSRYGVRPLLPLLCAIAGITLYSIMLKWQPWASRLQIALFFIATPSLALILTQRLRPVACGVICILFAVQAYPYWAHNVTRPLTGPQSILQQPATTSRLYQKPWMQEHLERISRHLQRKKCRNIGLIASEDEWELPLFTNLYIRPTIHACPAPPSHPRDLWLPERASSNPNICALVWFGEDAPEQVETCGRSFIRVEGPQHVSFFTPQKG